MRIVNHTGIETAGLVAVGRKVEEYHGPETRGRVVHVIYVGSPKAKKLPRVNVAGGGDGAVTVTVPKGVDSATLGLKATPELFARALLWVFHHRTAVSGSLMLLSLKTMPPFRLAKPRRKDPEQRAKELSRAVVHASMMQRRWASRVAAAQRRVQKWLRAEQKAIKALAKLRATGDVVGGEESQEPVEPEELRECGDLAYSYFLSLAPDTPTRRLGTASGVIGELEKRADEQLMRAKQFATEISWTKGG